jgi:hypothetical protein
MNLARHTMRTCSRVKPVASVNSSADRADAGGG